MTSSGKGQTGAAAAADEGGRGGPIWTLVIVSVALFMVVRPGTRPAAWLGQP